MEKVVEKKVFNRRPPRFSCIRLWKRQQCCKPEIGEKLKLPTSFHPNQARIKFSTGQCVKEVLCDIAPTNSCHLLLRWAWVHFKTLHLVECSLYLRHERHEISFEILDTKTSQEGSTYVEGENRKRKNRKRRNIKCRMKGNWRKRKRRKEKDYGKGSRELGV